MPQTNRKAQHNPEETNILRNRLAAIVESSYDGIVSKNLDGIILSWNKGAEKIFGYKAKEIIGKPIFTIIPPELLKEEEYIISKIKSGERVEHFETIRLHKSGKRINVSITVSPLKDSKGSIVGASKIARDITERATLARQKEDFVGMVSHELKTPVTSLKLFSHILGQHLKNQKDTKGIEHTQRIDEQLDRLTKLIIDLLDVTRLEKGKLEYNKHKFSLRTLIIDIIKDLEQAYPTHALIFKSKIDKNIYADKDRIRQVLINLITNAIKYSPKAHKVVISLKEKDGMMITSVQDFGIGIEKDQQEKIFNRFYQVNSPQLKTYPGLGLGLYICNEIIVHNGGKLWVKSAQHKGATFSFSLPIK